MKKILLIIILLMLFAADAEASEILGTISTNPNAPSGRGNDQPIETPEPEVKTSRGAVILPIAKQPENKAEDKQAFIPKKVVLGEKIYPDGTLLRGADHKIYLIQRSEEHTSELQSQF